MGIKINLEDFVEEIVLDLLDCECTSEEVRLWKKTFLEMVNNREISNKNLKTTPKGLVFEIKDEIEIFSITQDYIEALENNDLKTYWNTFKWVWRYERG